MVVGEDQPIVREGIISVLSEAGLEVVASAADGPDLVRKSRSHAPDVVVTDIQMPPGSGADGLLAACEIRATQPDVGVLVLSQFLEDRYVRELVGARPEGVGYLLKDRVGDLTSFVDAVRRVAGGGCVLDPTVVARLVDQRRTTTPIERLTPRERQVMALVAEGCSNTGIANALVVTVPAVERHITSIFEKLELPQSTHGHRRVLAVLQYLRN
ncbi:MAG TPA: response regulator transcription factor [Solirubrobacteraceae bacterium]|nr:response regulator transcription factor [Solirubrobacteraceae bacterium]